MGTTKINREEPINPRKDKRKDGELFPPQKKNPVPKTPGKKELLLD